MTHQPQPKPWREYEIHKLNTNSDCDSDDDEDLEGALQLFQPNDVPLTKMTFSAGKNVHVELFYEEDYAQSTGRTVWGGGEQLATFLVEQSDWIRQQIKMQSDNTNTNNNARLLELGAGVGLVGLVAQAALDLPTVCLTDGDSYVLDLLQRNVDHYSYSYCNTQSRTKNAQKPNISCRQLIWGMPESIQAIRNLDQENNNNNHDDDDDNNNNNNNNNAGRFDLIVATDVWYVSKSLDPLFRTVQQLLRLPTGKNTNTGSNRSDRGGLCLMLNASFAQESSDEAILERMRPYQLMWERVELPPQHHQHQQHQHQHHHQDDKDSHCSSQRKTAPVYAIRHVRGSSSSSSRNSPNAEPQQQQQ